MAYVWSGLKNLRLKPFGAEIKVDGVTWFTGKSSCVLFGNVGDLFGGVDVFGTPGPTTGCSRWGSSPPTGFPSGPGRLQRPWR